VELPFEPSFTDAKATTPYCLSMGMSFFQQDFLGYGSSLACFHIKILSSLKPTEMLISTKKFSLTYLLANTSFA